VEITTEITTKGEIHHKYFSQCIATARKLNAGRRLQNMDKKAILADQSIEEGVSKKRLSGLCFASLVDPNHSVAST